MTPLELSHRELVARLNSLRVPRIVGEADGHDLRNLADHAIEVAQAVDAYMRAIGAEAAANVAGFDQADFDHPLFGALDGNGLYALHAAADELDEEYCEGRAA